ncbi:hypothetical protein [Brevundimonas sp.]|uniref:hypothetical protein n=1 Tax=Brevundimonas sp. TaxID=1871086 RepID=UPI003F7157B4
MQGSDNLLVAPADAPAILHFAADVLLFLHIAGASVAMIAGFVAVIARKGDTVHRAAGNVFFVSMLVMAGVAGGVSPFVPEIVPVNIAASVMTLYLVTTGWMTVKRPEGAVGGFETGAMLFAVGLAPISAVFGRITGDPTLYFFAGIATLAALADFTMLRRRGLTGVPRIARHLWRMCAAFFIATGSFFFGQADEIPAVLRGPLTTVLGLAPLGFLLFWIVWVRISRAFKSAPIAVASGP